MIINLTINGIKREFNISPDEYLLGVLRKNGFVEVKSGCDTSSCGVCTVLIDGKPILSCSILAARADGHEITTVEGIKDEAKVFAGYLINEGADQCGFCSPAIALMLYALKKEIPNPTDEEIKNYLMGNLCRCSGYEAQHRAIEKYLEVKK